MALFTCTAKLDPGAHGARCAWAMSVHHAVNISRQRNIGYRPSRVNIMAQGLSTPDPSLSPTHLSMKTGRATITHYTHHQVSLMVSRNTTLVPSLGLRIGPSCEAGLSAGMRKERVPPRIRKKEKKKRGSTVKNASNAKKRAVANSPRKKCSWSISLSPNYILVKDQRQWHENAEIVFRSKSCIWSNLVQVRLNYCFAKYD